MRTYQQITSDIKATEMRLEQLEKERDAFNEHQLKLRHEKYAKCDHEYLPSGGKWSPQSQMTCINCGHTKI